ncbi:MAG: hypothetical protein AAGB93_02375 [Planctomycetota bacterium]
MKRSVLSLSLGLFALAACRSSVGLPEPEAPPALNASHPVPAERVPEERGFVVDLQTPSRRGTGATAFALSASHLLTTRRVIESWRGEDEEPLGVTLRVDGVLTTARIAARGWTGDRHARWALLECPRRPFAATAPVHQPARDPEWTPALGSEIVLLRPRSASGGKAALAAVAFELQHVDATSWVAAGGPHHERGSVGAPAMVWNDATSRLEVIGVFVHTGPIRQLFRRTTRVDGIPHVSRCETIVGRTYTIERLSESALAVCDT